ncbi:5-(carboxyamino)imidazole ribonucleotide synthase [Pseudonocardia sp.]|uniref:5-(carboxyamino)imidazole ribonucleotide synthase n=1 Tax=Pseudonocardia sp. TaxID=60912 RepID=UPI0026238B7A|nr:5-(carboxyamino)imidazole ribonucleotide synthase [Pseudonocardia sp.]
MVGGGQLARMTHQAAIALGQSLRVLAVDEGDPAALVCADVRLGRADDPPTMRAFASGCSAVTFDHEQVPPEVLHRLVGLGVPVHPGPDALLFAQDKLAMRARLADLGVPVPDHASVHEPADVTAFGAVHGWPVVLKAVRGGYDGRGVWVLDEDAGGLVAELLAVGTPLMVERAVPLRRELAALVARSPHGQASAWPVVETVQEGGQCVQVLAPAPDLDDDVAAGAQRLALRLAAELGVTGLLAVELFEDTSGAVLVNELAMRPHNSGHWTIEGSRTSQFEQHLRAVLDYPLGTTTATAPAVVMANVLGAAHEPAMGMDERVHHLFARLPDVKVHLYGKAARPDRKIGHVTALGRDMATVRGRAALAAAWLSTARWPDGWSPHTGAPRA